MTLSHASQARRRTPTRIRLGACFTMAVAVALASLSSAHAAVTVPTVSPAPAGTHGFPYGSSALDLASYGYVEEEYFISGSAQAFYNTAAMGNDGRWAAQPNSGTVSPYVTRILVRRPTDTSKFNGTVLVEWLNVSGGADGSPDWSVIHPELLREGYAYVAVSAQYVGVSGLKRWETGTAARYAQLAHPGDSFSYDIFSQAAAAIKTPKVGNPKPLGTLTARIRRMLADGESQSAQRMITYYNAVHPSAKLFNGFLIHSAGAGSPLSQSYAGGYPPNTAPAPAGVAVTPDITVPPTSFIRIDQIAPVMLVNTETDITLLGAGRSIHGQADSSKFRMWELAGTAHADKHLIDVGAADGRKSGGSAVLDCGALPISNDPGVFGMRAAVYALDQWVRDGKLPRSGPRLSVTVPAGDGQVTINRDPATGLALGGVRLPQIAVPWATVTGERSSAAVEASPFCFLFGAFDLWNGNTDSYDGQAGVDPSPTPEPSLGTLYGTRSNFLNQYTTSAKNAVAAGFIRPRDLQEVLNEGAAVAVP